MSAAAALSYSDSHYENRCRLVFVSSINPRPAGGGGGAAEGRAGLGPAGRGLMSQKKHRVFFHLAPASGVFACIILFTQSCTNTGYGKRIRIHFLIDIWGIMDENMPYIFSSMCGARTNTYIIFVDTFIRR